MQLERGTRVAFTAACRVFRGGGSESKDAVNDATGAQGNRTGRQRGV